MEHITTSIHQLQQTKGIKDLLLYGVHNNISDFWISPREPVKCNRYDQVYALTPYVLSRSVCKNIASILYGSKSVIANASGGNDCPCSYEFIDEHQNKHRFRVNISMSNSGISMTTRVIKSIPPTLEEIGLEDEILESVLNQKDAAFLISGRTGSGKSTTLAAMNRYELENTPLGIRLMTIESPIEYTYDKCDKKNSVVWQHEVPKHYKSFSFALRSKMRDNPTHLLIGETRDYETLDGLIQAAKSGHVAKTTLHASSVPATITRLYDFIPVQQRTQAVVSELIDSISCIVYQDLVRTPEGKRTACREFLVFNDEVKNYLYDNHTQIYRAAKVMVEKFGVPYERKLAELQSKGMVA